MKRVKDVYLRNNTAEQYRKMRDILRTATPEPQDPPPQPMAWWKIALIIGMIGAILCFLGGVGYASEMKASYYSTQSLKKEGTWAKSGGIMANGHRFDENALTCATGKQYPLGSRLLVTNKANGKSVVCVVSDRISRRFYTTRVDLSKGAFSKIAHLNEGLVMVDVKQVKIMVK